MKLNEMKAILDQRGLQLTKSLGQNFLHDENQLRRIVDAAELRNTDSVLEIGPGLGPLTEHLVMYASTVTAIELDQRLCQFLRERFVAVRNLTLIHADALAYLKERVRDWSQWKLVANLPYSVASPILVELAIHGSGPIRMVSTVQREVAERIVAKPDTDDYGMLSLFLQLDYHAKYGFKVPSGCFFPEPGVESACVILSRRPSPLLGGPLRDVYVRLVKRAFSQRRKMMIKLIKAEWPEEQAAAAIAQVGLRPDIRAEKVTVEQFVELTKLLGTV